MKVLYIITKGVWGGAQRYVYDLATALQVNGTEVVVACGAGEELPERLASANIRTVRLESLGRDVNPLADWQSFRDLYQLYKIERPDVVHLNSSKIGGLGALAVRIFNLECKLKAKSCKLKAVFTAHGWAWNEERPAWQRWTIKFISWLTIMLCHRVIVIAKREQEQALAMPLVSARKIRLIYNGLGDANFLTKDQARRGLIARGDLPLSPTENTVWIGTIAELHRNKGLSDGLEALRTLSLGEGRGEAKNWVWLIIGEGEERERLAKQIKALGLERQVYLLGQIPEAARWLKAFDLFLLPSRKEGLPYVILEAGLARRAVLASQAGGIPEIITAGQTGLLFPPGDTLTLARALNKLINDKAERDQLGRRLAVVVSKKFSLARLARETMAIYNE